MTTLKYQTPHIQDLKIGPSYVLVIPVIPIEKIKKLHIRGVRVRVVDTVIKIIRSNRQLCNCIFNQITLRPQPYSSLYLRRQWAPWTWAVTLML